MNNYKLKKYRYKFKNTDEFGKKKDYIRKIIKYGGVSKVKMDTKKVYKKIISEFKRNSKQIFNVYTSDLRLFTIIKYKNKIYYYDEDVIVKIAMEDEHLEPFTVKLFTRYDVVCIIKCQQTNYKLNDYLYTIYPNTCLPFFGNMDNIPKFPN